MVRSTALAAFVAALSLAGCATPYQETGFLGGVTATRIDGTTLQISARGNGYTDPDVIQRFTLRKAAEETIAAGYDLFEIVGTQDRTVSGSSRSTYVTGGGGAVQAFSLSTPIIKPGETIMVRMSKGPKPANAPPGMFDAREALTYLVPATAQTGACQVIEGKMRCRRL